jgi:Na+/H+-dicarboxylate symporter/ABC-type amino acid transport substrate-binding protein
MVTHYASGCRGDPDMTDGDFSNRWKRLSLSSRILIGLGVGILTGVFFGELVQPLEVVSNAYIRLMQMTVIPYMAVALIVGLGQLTLSQAKLLAVRGMVLLLVFWAISFVVLFLMPLSFPDLKAASFFSTPLIAPKRSFDFVELYIPANPFNALANNVVPAVVFFSASVGIALIGIKDKTFLMSGLQTFLEALTRVAKFIVNLTPVGVFAIGAVTAGTMTIDQFARLPVYFVTFIVAALVLTFWILPALISAVTPFKYKDILTVSKDALLTAFLTQSLFIVVPILIDHSKRLLKQYQVHSKDTDKLVDVIIPVTFNFPSIGKLMTLLFIPFTAWMSGSALELFQYPRLFLIGIASYFAKAQTALPFLMDQFEIPQDLFQLYIPTSIITGKFDTLVSAINLLAFSLIGTGALIGYLELKPMRIFRYLALSALALILMVAATGVFLGMFIDTTFQKGQGLMQMRLMGKPVPMIVHKTNLDKPGEPGREGLLTIQQIKARGDLRVGYVPQRYPFAFFNDSDELVGFDIEVANLLATDLGVRLVFVPTHWNELVENLDKGTFDLFPSMPYLSTFLELVEYSDPVLTGTPGFVVKDHRRHGFATVESLIKQGKLKVGVPANVKYLKEQFREWLPHIDFDMVELASLEDFFKSNDHGVDALFITAEYGMALTLLHPDYAVVVPKPIVWRLPQGFATAKGNFALSEYLDGWVATHRQKGSFQRAYNYWILGEGAKAKHPRWSVVRNVLHWAD